MIATSNQIHPERDLWTCLDCDLAHVPGRPSPVQRNTKFTVNTSEDEFSMSREGIETQVEDRELF